MKSFIGFVFCFISMSIYAQDLHAWVYFTDKSNVATSLANPQTILTNRAIQRKARHNITIDSRDVPVNQNYVNQIKSQTGITYKTQSKWFNCVHVTGLEADIRALDNLSFVDSIDFADPTKSAQIVDEHEFVETTTPPLDYGNAFNQIDMIGLDQLHNTGNTGTGITIAVTDSGFPNVNTNTAFAQLRANNGIAGGYDFVAGDSSYYGDHFHGARVLSILAAQRNNSFEGSAPDAQYYLYRTEDSASETPVEMSYWVAAAERADSLGVDVINVSLGYLGFDNSNESMTYSDMNGQTAFISRGARVASDKGIVVVVSAGNSGQSTSHPYIAAPADTQEVLSIGAVDASEQRISFSSTGPTFDNRLKPDVMSQGVSTALINENDALVTGNGTSYSAPLISGGMACLLQAFPNLTPQQIIDAVKQSADRFNTPDNQYGHGIPDFGNAYTTLNIIEQENDFSYYVNDNRLVIESSKQTELDIHVFNLMGQQLWQGKVQVNEAVDLNFLSGGLYLISIQNMPQTTFKIIIE